MVQSAMEINVLRGQKGSIVDGPMIFRKPTKDDTCVGPSTAQYALSYTCTARDAVYLTSDFKWAKADADGSALLYSSQLGVVMEDGADGDFVMVALNGAYIYAATALPTLTGAPVYLSATAGAMSETLPTADVTAVRVMGYGVSADIMKLEIGALKFVNGAGQEVVLPTVAAAISGPQDSTRVSGYTTAAAYDAVILASTNKWVKTDANTASLYNGHKGIVAVGGATDAIITVALPGSYIKTAGTYTVGVDLYLSETAAGLTTTLPSTGTSCQIIAATAITATVLKVRMEAYQVTSGA